MEVDASVPPSQRFHASSPSHAVPHAVLRTQAEHKTQQRDEHMSITSPLLPRGGNTVTRALFLGAAFAVAGCDAGGVYVARLSEPELSVNLAMAPPNAPEGSCWGRDETPATVQTVTERFLVQPAEIDTDGTLRQPAVYRTETSQEIVHARHEIWFETPCSEDVTEDFVVSLQRALEVRGFYRGPINGEMDARTRRSVRKYQQEQGLDTSILSLEAAQQLGLLAYTLDTE
jgi:hypothetical protein